MNDLNENQPNIFKFYKKGKKNSILGAEVKPPYFGNFDYKFADTHAHINMLENPEYSIAKAYMLGISFIECMTDPLSNEGLSIYDDIDSILQGAQSIIKKSDIEGHNRKIEDFSIRFACGVHPHYAKNWDENARNNLLGKLKDSRTSAIGEIGLDYHYDFSPRDIQIAILEEQLQIAQNSSMPVILHIREAFDDAYSILQNFRFLNNCNILLHCYTSNSIEIQRWIDQGIYIAFGGATTFKKLDDLRKSCKMVPTNQLLFETDSPFMTPEPFRGLECDSAYILFVAKLIMDLFEINNEDKAYDFLSQIYQNSLFVLNKNHNKFNI